MKQVFKIKELAANVRPTLKNILPLETYRLLRVSGMQEIFGESTGPVLYRLGKILISYFDLKTEEEFLQLIQKLGIGLPKIYKSTEDNVIMHLFECMTCAGLPITGELICNLECGFIAGGYEKITGKKAKGTQTKSWTTGNGFCEFVIELF
jgi:predicted hydrocarbon binding protein